MGEQPHTLTDSERLDWLRLIRSENVGPRTFRRLVDHFGSAAAALAEAPAMSRRGGRGRAIRIAAREQAEAELAELAAIGARLVARGEPDYPSALAAIDDAPPLIAVRGDASLLSRRFVAIVGARNASAAGRRFARDLAGDLGRAGIAVCSGMARGIDTAAHEGSFETGTAAVLAGGVDTVYPPENAGLYERLIATGVVISEQPAGLAPQARHFPPRNRLISGLALGVIVVEAAPRSGSLITARMALEQGREVFAVPGSPRDPRCRGPNDLIRNGATLTESAADVIEALDGPLRPAFARPAATEPAPAAAPQPDDSAVDAGRSDILEKLGPTPVTVDELVRECQLSPPVVQAALLELELAGKIERQPGNRVSLVP